MTDTIENTGPKKPAGIWIFNIVLMVGLIVMYFLHFTKTEPERPPLTQQPVASDMRTGPRIAMVNSDILMAQYEMVPELIKSFENSTKSKEAVIREKQKEFEEKLKAFQTRIQSGNISMDLAQITEQQLMKEQQDLINLRDELSEELAREEYEMNIQLYEIVSLFLEEYNKTRQYDLIFNFKQGTNIFIANQAFDITPEVIELLNHEYRLRKPRR
jgi:outer membrane protein